MFDMLRTNLGPAVWQLPNLLIAARVMPLQHASESRPGIGEQWVHPSETNAFSLTY